MSKENKLAEIMENRRRDRARINKPRYLHASVLTSVRKSLQTTAVGAIAQFEEIFGPLWGHGKEELTEEELQWEQLWKECRFQIFNLLQKEIERFEDTK